MIMKEIIIVITNDNNIIILMCNINDINNND